ncbi:MAG TPA: multicopper oxidase domain-containing protein [Candidatus Limnocylindria bacterium]|nr:multicopper oxidase domain-containing protein [Candidatus Limnocylindria bacterium]
MNNFKPPAPPLLFLCGMALLISCAIGWSAEVPAVPFPPVPTNTVQPTVTAQMGDVGGKFFGRTPDSAKTRHYYIAAEPELWDYAPQGQDPVCGKPLPPPVLAQRRVAKMRYVQYTDATFTTKVFPTARLGIMGPVLRGVVGDFLAVTFINRGGQPFSMHPHGVKYDKDSEGSYYEPRPGLGAAVAPDAKFTYVWHLDAESGPMPGEPSSKGWLYHSHVNGDEEANLGLVGFIVVTDPQRARPDGTPADVDREQAALFMIFDESGLGEAEREAAEYASLSTNNSSLVKPWSQVQEILEQGARAAINGYIFGNLPGLELNEGERVRWYLFGLGSEKDFHTAHWHGQRVLEEGRRRTDVVDLLPASMKVADMIADNPGSWLFHCHVSDHMTEGMFASVNVHPKSAPASSKTAGPAFFGLAAAQQSLQIKKAEASLEAGGDCRIGLAGVVVVFDAFSVFTQPVTFEILGRTLPFKPDRRGRALAAGGEFQIKNAGEFGVVYGGQMEFELRLQGKEWREGLTKLGLTGAGPQRVMVPFKAKVGSASHEGLAEVQCVFK